MKRLLAGVSLLTVVLSGCTAMLLYDRQIPEFKAAPDKAICVVIRPVAITGNVFIPVYLDAQYVGGTEGNTVLSFPVTPGEHIVIADATNKSMAKFNFQAGKTYYIQQTVVTIEAPFVTINTSTFTPKTGPDAMNILATEKGKSTWVQPNPASLRPNLTNEALAEVKKEYDKWAAKPENAKSLQTEKEYPGY